MYQVRGNCAVDCDSILVVMRYNESFKLTDPELCHTYYGKLLLTLDLSL